MPTDKKKVTTRRKQRPQKKVKVFQKSGAAEFLAAQRARLREQLARVDRGALTPAGRTALDKAMASPNITANAMPTASGAMRSLAQAWMNAGKTVKPGGGPTGGAGRTTAMSSGVMGSAEVARIKQAVQGKPTMKRKTKAAPKRTVIRGATSSNRKAPTPPKRRMAVRSR